jgi:Leu/Phe-tRNA-protein transferase
VNRTRAEIAGAARILREAAAVGELLGDDTTITRARAMAKTAEALAWASGVDNEFVEVLQACREIDEARG